jgi:hypothetical protein
MYRANTSSEMSSPSMSSLKSCPCKPPRWRSPPRSRTAPACPWWVRRPLLTSVLASLSLPGIIRRRRSITRLFTEARVETVWKIRMSSALKSRESKKRGERHPYHRLVLPKARASGRPAIFQTVS